MPSAKDNMIDLVVDDIMNLVPRKDIPPLTLHEISKRTSVTSRYLYHALSRYESITFVQPIPSHRLSRILSDSIKNPMSLLDVKRDTSFSSYVPLQYTPWMIYHGYGEEAHALWEIRRSTGTTFCDLPRLPFVIWYLDLPIRVRLKEKKLCYDVMESPTQRALDSVKLR